MSSFGWSLFDNVCVVLFKGNLHVLNNSSKFFVKYGLVKYHLWSSTAFFESVSVLFCNENIYQFKWIYLNAYCTIYIEFKI